MADMKNSGENYNERRISKLYYQATMRLIEKFKECLPEETSKFIEMFSWMSLTQMRRKCKVVTDLDSFKKEEIKESVEFFLQR